jgi:hypothetical protein
MASVAGDVAGDNRHDFAVIRIGSANRPSDRNLTDQSRPLLHSGFGMAQQERSALLNTTSRERRATALIIAQVDRPSE